MLTLVIGGAGSGKSAFAESLVLSLPGKRIYLASMLARDAESKRRVERHRAQRRGKGFETLERGLDLEHADIPEGTNLLLEDLSNLLANELYEPAGGGAEGGEQGLHQALAGAGVGPDHGKDGQQHGGQNGQHQNQPGAAGDVFFQGITSLQNSAGVRQPGW
jgi:hypothetical protein